MSRLSGGTGSSEDTVTFCTYGLLDFEVHSTPLVSGSQPNYGFTSRYALTARDLGRLGGQGSRVRVELHQALGGVKFVTHGSGQMSLMGTMERRGQRVSGRFNITGKEFKKMFCTSISHLLPVLDQLYLFHIQASTHVRTVSFLCPSLRL